MRLAIALLFGVASVLFAQKPENVLVVVNQASPISRSIGEYYVLKRHIPLANVCRLTAKTSEQITHADYQKQIAAPIASFLRARRLQETILYIVTTSGVPLAVQGTGGPIDDGASVDSELTLLYSDLRGKPHEVAANIPNPFFGKSNLPFRHPDFPIYLVTRLTGYDFADVKGIIDRALLAQNRGKFVIDLKLGDSSPGNDWLLQAAAALPKDRVVLDQTSKVLYNESDVIGYASWGSNDHDRRNGTWDFIGCPAPS